MAGDPRQLRSSQRIGSARRQQQPRCRYQWRRDRISSLPLARQRVDREADEEREGGPQDIVQIASQGSNADGAQKQYENRRKAAKRRDNGADNAGTKELVATGRHELAAAGFLCLDRRALHRTERAEDAAIAGVRLKNRPAARALVEELASVGRHGFALRESALRAAQDRLENLGAHCFGVEG